MDSRGWCLNPPPDPPRFIFLLHTVVDMKIWNSYHLKWISSTRLYAQFSSTSPKRAFDTVTTLSWNWELGIATLETQIWSWRYAIKSDAEKVLFALSLQEAQIWSWRCAIKSDAKKVLFALSLQEAQIWSWRCAIKSDAKKVLFALFQEAP